MKNDKYFILSIQETKKIRKPYNRFMKKHGYIYKKSIRKKVMAITSDPYAKEYNE